MNTNNSMKLPRSFTWLNVTQFLGALNDNVFKLLVILVLVNLMGEPERTTIVATVFAVFVVPFLLFSHAGGVLADRFSKQRVIVALKVLEAAVMIGGCAAVYFRSRLGLYAGVFLMSTQSAIFGPAKYGIIPELVGPHRLSKANGLLVGLTYLAIIIGTFLPSFSLDYVFAGNFLGPCGFCIAIALIGVVASLYVERTPAVGAGKRFSPLFVVDIVKTLRSLRHDGYLVLSIFASSYFLYLAAFINQNTLDYGPEFLGLTTKEAAYLFPVAALGIGIGALIAGRFSGRNIEFGIVPIGALGLTVAALALSVIEARLVPVLVLIGLLGVSSGLFVVPLNAFIQQRSPEARRGEILAATNFFSFLGVALSAGTLWLLAEVFGLDAQACFLVVGLLTAVLLVMSVWVLPDFLVRFVILLIARPFYRIRTVGLENLPVDGPALLVSNHVTWADAFFLAATTQRRIRFVMGREFYNVKLLQPLFRLMGVIPISPADGPRQVVASLKQARAALDDGYLVCIFAEGAVTRNGNMRGFRPGLERIVKGTTHPIVPVYIGGAWGSIFSYCGGKPATRWPRAIPYPVSVSFGPALPATASSAQVRQAVLEQGAESWALKKSRKRSLSRAFVKTARANWFRWCLSDTTGKRLNYGQALTGALALAGELAKMTPGQERVGVLLPASAGGALTNMALTLSGKVPVNLNFTASAQAIESAIGQCGIETIVSARAFVSKLESFSLPQGVVYLEDIAPRIGAGAKLRALLKAAFAPGFTFGRGRHVGPDDVATIIFSSGSTGEPKGVLLTHHNILSNIESFRAVYHFTRADRLCAFLPFFHSFGFTCTLWCPLVTGFAVFFHPNPLDAAKIAEIVREHRLTVLVATPTFLLPYIRRAKREDFASLRGVIVGAEKLKKRVADAFEEKFGLRPQEGYGTTELSPVAALNVDDVEIGGVRQVGMKDGSIGHPIPGMAAKIVHPETGAMLAPDEEGLLLMKGPNVMLGYLRKPEKTAEVLREGWYDTGDIARIDEDGFVFLLDRLSRFSKIGGEMVPHMAVEEKLLGGLEAMGPVVVVTSAADEKKGEQLVVFYTEQAGPPEKLQAIMKEADLPNLWKPRKENYFPIQALPTLGSGKLDLKRLKHLAREAVENRPGFVERMLHAVREMMTHGEGIKGSSGSRGASGSEESDRSTDQA
ncbi:MAG: MFS transporter [Kiritimatiellae bacterium]|nr:MFS transporter [Kiritimatiellia bacterium]